MMTVALERYRAPEPRWTYLVIIGIACLLTAALAVKTITARHEVHLALRRACEAELRAILAKTPGLRPALADPCEAVKAIKG